MKKLTLFTFLGIFISLVINFGSLANISLINNTVINNTVLAKEVEMQKSQSNNENTLTCALNQQADCSETLL